MLSLQWTETIAALRWNQPLVQNKQNEKSIRHTDRM